ncbi:NADH dehydrogenase [Ornatilinea apprima]|uniref:NADH dehydrogenase n=1 Tax=Ornatilinea apprima TaxID=1134406 RepID=A0A0P6WQ91_9CHLR|nr:NADH-quinone oxidoreductase subunit NuoE [Ornatilinea apprima]KPL72219.1 NADH dehydrogenase [Ornatilinea apprima]
MSIETLNEQTVREVVKEVVHQFEANPSELIPILSEVNRRLGYLPQQAMEEVSKLVKTPKSNVLSVSTFYHMLSTKPRGRHVIQFCESAPCHVVGGREVWLALKAHLQLEAGETTPDNEWTLVTTSCLGLCGIGPVVVIDDDVYGNVTPNQLPEILSRYQAKAGEK